MADRQTKVVLSAQVTQYIAAMKQAAAYTSYLGSETEKLAQQRQAFEQLGRGAVVAGAAVTAATALSVKAAIDWESAWAGVTKTVDGTDAEMAALEEQLRSLTGVLPATHEEIAGVAEAAGQLGVAREDVAAFTETMINLAETTNLTADEAATSIAQLMNVMQTAPEDVDNLGAALVALGNDGASTERDIVQMAQRIAGAGRIVGLSEAEVLGFANALASVGIEAEAGGTAISRIMTDIAMSVSQGGDELEAFAEVAGMSSAEFQSAFREAPADAIATFIEGLAKIDAAGGDVFKTLDDLGQSDIRVSQALLGMANSGDLLRESLDLGGVAWEDNLALIEEARKRYQTTEAQLQIMTNSVRDAAIDLGAVFLPAVKASAEGISGLAQGFADLPEPVQGITGILGGVAGAVALTGGAALLAVPKIAEFKTAMQTMGTTVGRVSLIGGGVTVALTALVAVVGTLATAHAEARQRAESYADAIAQGGDAIRDLAVDNLAAEQSWAWMSKGSAFDAAERLGVGLETLSEAAQGSSAAMKDLSLFIRAADGDEQALNRVVEESGLTRLEAVDALNTMVTTLRDQTSALDEGKRIEEQRNEVTKEGVDITYDASDAYEAAAKNVSDLDDELSTLLDTINKANGIGQDAVTANLDYQDALRDVEEQVKNVKDGVEGYGAGIDASTDVGADNVRMLVDMAQKAQEAADAQFALDGDTDAYRKTLEDSRQALLDRAEDLGGNADEAKALADEIFRIPSATEWKMIADVSDAQSKLQSIRDTLASFQNSGYGENLSGFINSLDRKAMGGPIYGSGPRGVDSVPILAAPGEHVWTTSEVDAAGGHGAMEQMRKWVSSGRGFTFGDGGGRGTAPVINQTINPQPGMSEYQIGQAAAQSAAFYMGTGE